MKKIVSMMVLLSLPVMVLSLTGCPPKKKMVVEEKPQEVAKVDETPKEDLSKQPKENELNITQDWTDVPALQVITFGFDAATLEEPQRALLKQNVAILKKLPSSVTIRVEAYCDDRGTVEYNIALGQRRADTLRAFYAASGLKKDRLQSISFGEERPLCLEATEECWARNRRGVTKVRNEAPITINTDTLK